MPFPTAASSAPSYIHSDTAQVKLPQRIWLPLVKDWLKTQGIVMADTDVAVSFVAGQPEPSGRLTQTLFLKWTSHLESREIAVD